MKYLYIWLIIINIITFDVFGIDKKKAIDIIGIETKELTVMSDYFIIASGTSNTHVRALADEVDDEMKKLGVEVDHIEGRATGWILLDYNDVLVHVFQPESSILRISSSI